MPGMLGFSEASPGQATHASRVTVQDGCGLGGSSTWSGSFFGSKGTMYFTRQAARQAFTTYPAPHPELCPPPLAEQRHVQETSTPVVHSACLRHSLSIIPGTEQNVVPRQHSTKPSGNGAPRGLSPAPPPATLDAERAKEGLQLRQDTLGSRAGDN
ncbi:Tbc1 Domain Family Member 24 [Manis pentadactyla]|nr:Tbc1 Domain Family Member 24 [Manis pentadactyla]